MSETNGTLPLAGMRVLDATNHLGSYGSRLLADLGADVIKIEPPGGSPLRHSAPLVKETGSSLSFSYWEANKRSIQLDVGAHSSREPLRRLAKHCDVVLLTPTSREPVVGFAAVADGVDWAPESAVVIFITPLGATGPLRSWRGTHLTSNALAGLMLRPDPPNAGAPRAMPGEQMYAYVGVHIAITALAALRARANDHLGRGQVADLSAHEIMSAANFDFHVYSGATRIENGMLLRTYASGGIWECADGEAMYLTISDRQWNGFLDLFGRPSSLADPALSNPAVRAIRRVEVMNAIRPLIKEIGRDRFVVSGQEHGVPVTLVNTVADYAADPQPSSRGHFVPIDIGNHQTAKAPGTPFLSTHPLLSLYRRAAPALSELTVEQLIKQWAVPGPAHQCGPVMTDIRVVSFGGVLAGALTASTLADLGADVVRIEHHDRPDDNRRLIAPEDEPVYEPSGVQTSPNFAAGARSVRGLGMDMKNSAAVDLALRLISTADVLIDNFSPGVMERWGLDPTRLSILNPRLVHLSISGFGHDGGPRSGYRAYGGTMCCFLGLTHAWGVGCQTHFDFVTYAHSVLAVQAALAARDRTGNGNFIDLSMMEAGSAGMGTMILDWTVNGSNAEPAGNGALGSVWSGVLPCSGTDTWVALELEDAADAAALSRVLGLSTAVGSAERIDLASLETTLLNWLADKTPMRAALLFQKAGLAASPVQNAEDLYRDPQLRARGAIVEIPHPDLGSIEFLAPVHRLLSTPPRVRAGAPRLGEHGHQILEEWLGLSMMEREKLVRSGAIWIPKLG